MHPLLDIPDQVDVLIQRDSHGFVPGNDGFLRLCFAKSEAQLSAAMDRIEAGLDTL